MPGGGLSGPHRAGHAEVRDQRVSRIEQDVGRLDIAMDHVAAVGIAQRVGHLPRDLQRIGDGQLPLAIEALAQGLALDVRHDVVDQAVHLVGVVQRKDVGMVQAGGDLDLVQEPGGADFLRQVGPQHLDRDVTIVLEVVGEKDTRHPALAQLALEAVPRGQGVAQSFKKLGHVRRFLPGGPALASEVTSTGLSPI